ncbi:MAG: flagellar hook-length control protein FliK [Roseobacter sp.]|jgi:hypothetical protein|nr:flagellar hook-length control protein FliK [Roseobacter sp.]
MLDLPIFQSSPQATRSTVSADKSTDGNAKSETAQDDFETEYKDSSVENKARDSVSDEAPDKRQTSEAEEAEPKPEASPAEDSNSADKNDKAPKDKSFAELEPSVGAVEGTKKADPEAASARTGQTLETLKAAEAAQRVNPASRAVDATETIKGKQGSTEADTASDTKNAKPNSTTAENVVLTKAAETAVQRPATADEKTISSGKSRGEDAPVARTGEVSVKGQQDAPSAPQKVLPLQAASEKSLRQQAKETSELREPPIREAAEVPRKTAAQPQTPTANMMFANAAAQSKQFVLQDKKDTTSLVLEDFDLAESIEQRATTQSGSTSLNQVLQRAETPAMIARQMAEALQRLPDRPVEISLNPKELGRVRMNISAAEAGITVNVIAERPETLDLMRRNIEQLAREFEMIGYSDINFAFSEGETQQGFSEENESSSDRPYTYLDLETTDVNTPPPESTQVTTGVDIRL